MQRCATSIRSQSDNTHIMLHNHFHATRGAGLLRRLLLFVFSCTCLSSGALTPEEEERIARINLPLVEITTVSGADPTCTFVAPPPGCMGNGITNNFYLSGRIRISEGGKVVYNSGEYRDGVSGMRIKVRGNSSAYPPKKPYRVKLTHKADLLQRGDDAYEDKEWLLLGNYQDTHTLQTVVGLKVGRLVGMEWEPEWRYVHVVLNGKYRGCYLLCEPVERGERRCDIEKSGYLVENDAYWWNTDETVFHSERLTPAMGYTFKYPAEEDLTTARVDNIRNYINAFEERLYEDGDIAEYIDLASFAGWTLGQDILGTFDGCGSNMFLYKKDYVPAHPTSTKLKLGPLWDFDSNYRTQDEWSAQHGIDHFYVKKLFERPDFLSVYADKWEEIKGTLHEEVMNEIKALRETDGEAIVACRELEEELFGLYQAVSWESTEQAVDEWFSARIAWLDAAIGQLSTGIDGQPADGAAPLSVSVFDATGRLRLSARTGVRAGSDEAERLLREAGAASGLYIVREQLPDGTARSRKLLLR